MDAPFTSPIAEYIWQSKYRFAGDGGRGDDDMDAGWWRVAHALAAVEPRDQAAWAGRFHAILSDFRFLPGGRILAGAGTAHRVTLLNCFVMGLVEDSIDGIFRALHEGALTLQAGGGVGYDFSTLRPAGSRARAGGNIASGPVSFMRVWDSMCATLLATGNRRGAMMATLRCDHPDIERFIEAKRSAGELRHFNLSVLIGDDFMRAVAEDAEWPLVFPAGNLAEGGGETVLRRWSGQREPVPCRVLRRLPARSLWQRLLRASYDVAEPGVLFIDRINRENNLAYREWISATNPCGEIPLPPYGACDLGSIDLPRFVRHPFGSRASLDLAAVADCARSAVRLLDNVLDASHYPLPQQREQVLASRRLGLGITGLADALAMLGQHYASAEARDTAAGVLRRLRDSAYQASIELAREKGAFPAFEAGPYLEGPFVQRLPEELRRQIARHGLRNSHLLAIAPTGTISLLANNVSSGIEPIFDLHYRRRVREAEAGEREFEVEDHAYALWRRRHPDKAPPPAFVTARELPPEAHLAMQAALQPLVDNAISKTINIPADFPFDAYRDIYQRAFALGLKGCTTFRPNPVTGSVLASEGEGVHCCSIEREPA